MVLKKIFNDVSFDIIREIKINLIWKDTLARYNFCNLERFLSNPVR